MPDNGNVGGSTASYLAHTPRIPLFLLIFIRLETKNVLDYQGRAGSTSIVQWTLRPVIFGVEIGALPLNELPKPALQPHKSAVYITLGTWPPVLS